MAGQEHVPDDNSVLMNGVAHQLEHGALLLLSPLFCGLICMFWCSFLQICNDTSIIRRRSVQLKFRTLRVPEGDDRQHSIQQLLSKQTSTANSANRLSRKLSRRASGLEQDFGLCQKELVDCQRKLLDCQKENNKLQEELSEVTSFKSKLADLLRRENEERSKLEKQQSVFQNQAFTAVFERDRLTSEIEKLKRKEDEMTEKLADLQDRLDLIDYKYTAEKTLCGDLQKELDKSNQEVVLYRKVIDKFWRVRAQASEGCESQSIEERAAILLQDDEGYWSYGDLNKFCHDEAAQARENLATLKEEFDVCCNSLSNCQAQNLEESSARKHAEDALINCREQLLTLAKQVDSELQHLSSMKASLKEDVSVFFLEETNWMLSLQEALQHISKEDKGVTGAEPAPDFDDDRCSKESDDINMNASAETVTDAANVHGKGDKVNGFSNGGFENRNNVSSNKNTDNVTSIKFDFSAMIDEDSLEPTVKGTRDDELAKGDHGIEKQDVSLDDCITVPVDDSKEALAQALQEKVAALLLLSQQEERHILESNTAVVLESEISSLKQQLVQVTSEKVDALMELAQAHEELRKLKESFKQTTQYGRTLSSGQLTPVEDYSSFFDNNKSPRGASMQSYLKQLWLKAPELGVRTKSLSHMLTLRSSKETDTVGIARLRIENATLRESLNSIRHLCKSANRLRLTIARVAADSSAQTESFIQAAVQAVDGVISEALHLKVALHDSLPVDDLGWNSIGSPLARASESDPEGSDYDANDDLHIVSFFGLEIVRLVLLAAQLQKRCLGQNS